MTPKEKAEELLNKYKDLSIVTTYNGNDYNIVAKKCALILVDEIITNRKEIHMKNKLYWQKVKQEIENL